MAYPKPIENIDDLPKRYGGIERERFWQQYWMDCGVYNYDPNTPREDAYTIDTPPPTVSGALHIGHVFSYTQTDFSARFFRMMGKHVFYPFGFDDNGLPSERLVERITGKRAHEVGREEFIKLCEPILADAEQEFKDLWQSVALSCDWDQFYTTIDARSRAISQASFIDLYNKGYIYRKEAPTQWCWADQTAIAQAEIEDKEVQGKFHDITFQFDDGSGKLTPVTIATTRPELIPACVAVFAHPDDERYKHLFGKKAITPLFEVEVPILPSEKADPEKGTGILMCCTFGDQEDVEHWEMKWPKDQVRDGKLRTRVVIGRDGKMLTLDQPDVISTWETDLGADLGVFTSEHIITNWLLRGRNPSNAKRIGALLAGERIKKARQIIVDELSDAGLVKNIEPITHTVRHSERGGVPVEILVTDQWYIRLLDYKADLIKQGNKVKWHPSYMFKRFEHWVEGLNQDWCISRQRFNGVPFPVWHLAKHYMPIVAHPNELPLNPFSSKPTADSLRLTHEILSTNLPQFESVDYERNYKAALALIKKGANGEVEILTSNEAIERSNGDNEAYSDLTQTCVVVTPDLDVMDTWATSSLTTLLNTHLQIGVDDPETQSRHDKIFPYDLRPQAHDIIRTWAFYTIAKSLFHFGSEQDEDGKWRITKDEKKLRAALPWKDIVISGHAQDAKKKKISKSKGHVVTPAEMVEKYTADNLRYWSSSCKLGTDTIYDEKNLTEGKKLINKLFNATKFALRHLVDFVPGSANVPVCDPLPGSGRAPHRPEEINGTASGRSLQKNPEDGLVQGTAPTQELLSLVTYPTDKWMLGQLDKAIDKATKANQNYEFGDAKQAVEDFFWADLCDNYLELSKGRLYSDGLATGGHPNEDASQLRQSAQAALYIALSSVLKLFAPILPHITEECWSWYFAQFSDKRSIHEEAWPVVGTAFAGDDTLAGELLVQIIAVVRKWKSEHNVSLKVPVERLTVYVDQDSHGPAVGEMLAAIKGDLLSASNARICSVAGREPPEGAAKIEGNPYCVVCELAEVEGQ